MDSLLTLGLWGDGDEIWAIEEAFAALNLKVPVEDAANWITVADLWDSVLRISPEFDAEPQIWDNFRIALGNETGVDWTKVESTTKLIDGRGHDIISRLLTGLREKIKGAFAYG
jgi:hypothetical protein